MLFDVVTANGSGALPLLPEEVAVRVVWIAGVASLLLPLSASCGSAVVTAADVEAEGETSSVVIVSGEPGCRPCRECSMLGRIRNTSHAVALDDVRYSSPTVGTVCSAGYMHKDSIWATFCMHRAPFQNPL